MTIDWSKAPKGATHWHTDAGGWVKVEGSVTWLWIHQAGRQFWGKAEKYFPARCPIKAEHLMERPWTGEGLPPVGTVCEWHPNQDVWVIVEILGRNFGETWFRRKGAEFSETCLGMEFFRPIRTPEQIAAEEREKAIAEMCAATSCKPGSIAGGYVEKLYDAGYRKDSRAADLLRALKDIATASDQSTVGGLKQLAAGTLAALEGGAA